MAKSLNQINNKNLQPLMHKLRAPLNSIIGFTELLKKEIYGPLNEKQKEFLETLGLLAESYVTVVVAAPLFLIIIFSVMALFGGPANTAIILYLIAFVMLPIANLGFAMAIRSMAPEV